MQMVITFVAVVAGLAFSMAVALVAEELIFGQVFRIFLTNKNASQPVSSAMALQPVGVKSEQH